MYRDKQIGQRRLWFCQNSLYFTGTALWVEAGKVFMCPTEMYWHTVAFDCHSFCKSKSNTFNLCSGCRILGLVRQHNLLLSKQGCKILCQNLSELSISAQLSKEQGYANSMKSVVSFLAFSDPPPHKKKKCGTQRATSQKHWKCYSLINCSAHMSFWIWWLRVSWGEKGKGRLYCFQANRSALPFEFPG